MTCTNALVIEVFKFSWARIYWRGVECCGSWWYEIWQWLGKIARLTLINRAIYWMKLIFNQDIGK